MTNYLSQSVLPVAGVCWGSVAAGIKSSGAADLALMTMAAGSCCAAVYTRNAFCAAPVTVARLHQQKGNPVALLVNAGNANAGTGEAGYQACMDTCLAMANAIGCDAHQVLPFSTGVIGELLPAGKIIDAIPALLRSASADGWQLAAEAIMTTDTQPKLASASVEIDGKLVTITGICKGAGMIRPNMATMLAYIATDAAVEQAQLEQLLSSVVEQSFNRITVDGDTSTNDACVLVASGQSGVTLDEGSAHWQAFAVAMQQVFTTLATAIIRDAEGASKFVTIDVTEGGNEQECLAVAYTVAESPLVKTALFASDANWGRILAAVGRADVHCSSLASLDVNAVRILLGEVLICENGGRAASYTEEQGSAEMQKDEITITISLARGDASARVWTSDLSHDYVRINAEYRT